jgi:surfeit locus 1 family protein
MTRRFQPGLVPTVAAIVAVLLFSALGTWQLRRHAWRLQWLTERNARIDLSPVPIAEALADPPAFADRRAVARGLFVPSESIVVRGSSRGLERGVEVWTPLRLALAAPAGGDTLLVDRGTVPGQHVEAFLQEELAKAPVEVEITGLLFRLALQPVVPGAASESHREWQRFDPLRPDAVAALQAQLSRPLVPLGLQAAEGVAGELPVGGITRPVSPVDHVSYALFWFALAAAAAAHWVGFGVHRAREAARAARRATLPAASGGKGGQGGEP